MDESLLYYFCLEAKANVFRKENERVNKYLQAGDAVAARTVFLENSKPTTSKIETWDAAVRWARLHPDAE